MLFKVACWKIHDPEDYLSQLINSFLGRAKKRRCCFSFCFGIRKHASKLDIPFIARALGFIRWFSFAPKRPICVRAKCRPSSPSANANRIKNFLSTLRFWRHARFCAAQRIWAEGGSHIELPAWLEWFWEQYRLRVREDFIETQRGEQCSNKRNPFSCFRCGAPPSHDSQTGPLALQFCARCPWRMDRRCYYANLAGGNHCGPSD